MKIVVIGGTGFIGAKLVPVLRQGGHEVIAASPKMGVDTLTGQGMAEAMKSARVVVDVSNAPSFEDDAVMNFFMTSGHNLVTAEIPAGVRHHVVLSIVGADRLRDSGYLRAKIAQENLIKSSGIPYTIVRSTQFIEFMDRVADLFSVGTELRVPSAFVQPIVSDDVVKAVADITLKPAQNTTLEVAGPQPIRFDDLIRRVLKNKNDNRAVISDDDARYFGAKLQDNSLVPGATPAWIGARHLDNWLGGDGRS